MVTLLAFFVVLGVVVVVHELGHFTVAKLAGVRVLEFGVGFPPRLVGIRRGDTIYSLNLLPLGGFVRMAGEEDLSEPGSLANRSAGVRLAVLAAGPAMNVVLPVVLLTIFFMVPRSVPVTDVVITEVPPSSPAAEAQVLPGDVVREVDGRRVTNSADLQAGVQRRLGSDSLWVVERGGRLVGLRLQGLRLKPPSGEGAAGVVLVDARVSVASVEVASPAEVEGLRPGDLLVSVGNRRILFAEGSPASPGQALADTRTEAPGEPVPLKVLRRGAIVELSLPSDGPALAGAEWVVTPEERVSEPLWRAVPATLVQMCDIMVMFRNEVSRWISGVRPDVTGPIGIARITGEMASAGPGPLLFWTALLSMNLAIINILPVPALDGGRMTFVLLELVRGGRRISAQKERRVHLVGIAVLMSLMILLSINDIQRILTGE